MIGNIPEDFYRGDNHPVVQNVGELKKQLEKLPNDLLIQCGCEDGAAIIVYNVTSGNPVLEFTEVEEN